MAPPALPQLLKTKIYKTGQTRGADDDEIYQNRVNRNSTVLIPYRSFAEGINTPCNGFENGFIILIQPAEYLQLGSNDLQRNTVLNQQGIPLGEKSLVFYERRIEWNRNPPLARGWSKATSRLSPLGGQYVSRIPNTTSANNTRINEGFTEQVKGAGIRVYEYASTSTIAQARIQLEAIFWLASDAKEVCVHHGMTEAEADLRKAHTINEAKRLGLLDLNKLKEIRAINSIHQMTCPLCLQALSAEGFFTRLSQAAGREVHNLTVTSINLFHVRELRMGEYNHHPYNLAWGCHHCNVVTKDAGINETLNWMKDILSRNGLDYR